MQRHSPKIWTSISTDRNCRNSGYSRTALVQPLDIRNASDLHTNQLQPYSLHYKH